MCVDGNLAALKQYEDKIDASEKAYESMIEIIAPLMEEATEKITEAQSIIDSYGFDEKATKLLEEWL